MALDINPNPGNSGTGTDNTVSALLSRAGEAVRPGNPGLAADAPGVYVSDRRLYLTEDGTVVEDGDERGAYLLVGAGGVIPQALADELGVKPNRKKAAAAAPPEPAPVNVILNASDPVPGLTPGVITPGVITPATAQPATVPNAAPPALSVGTIPAPDAPKAPDASKPADGK